MFIKKEIFNRILSAHPRFQTAAARAVRISSLNVTKCIFQNYIFNTHSNWSPKRLSYNPECWGQGDALVCLLLIIAAQNKLSNRKLRAREREREFITEHFECIVYYCWNGVSYHFDMSVSWYDTTSALWVQGRFLARVIPEQFRSVDWQRRAICEMCKLK